MESVPDWGMAKFTFSAVCERGVRTAVVLVALPALRTVIAALYTGQGGLGPPGLCLRLQLLSTPFSPFLLLWILRAWLVSDNRGPPPTHLSL